MLRQLIGKRWASIKRLAYLEIDRRGRDAPPRSKPKAFGAIPSEYHKNHTSESNFRIGK